MRPPSLLSYDNAKRPKQVHKQEFSNCSLSKISHRYFQKYYMLDRSPTLGESIWEKGLFFLNLDKNRFLAVFLRSGLRTQMSRKSDT